MNALASLLALAAACLAALIVFELRPPAGAPADPAVPASPPSASVTPGPPAAAADRAAPVDVLLARPLFSQARRPAVSGPAAAVASAAVPLPRMTGILIDGPRRSAIFAAPGGTADGRPVVVAEGGRIGPFTVQTIEPQQVVVTGPDGKRIVRTSFDPSLPPPAAPASPDLGAPQFPGILAPAAPSPGYGQPLSAGAAR